MCFQVKSSNVFTPNDFTWSSCSSVTPHRTGFSVAAVQLREVDAEQRRFHVELNSERPVAQQEEEREFVGQIRAEIQAAQHGGGSGRESSLEDPGE